MASMEKPVFRPGAGSILPALALLTAFAALAAAPVLAQSQPSRPPAAAQGTPPRATAPAAPEAAQPEAVQDKFRKLQKEMARNEGSPGTAASAASGPMADEKPAPEKEPESVNVISLGFQILAGLAFVLILAVMSIRLLKKFQGKLFARSGPAGGGDILEVLESCHLGTNQRVVAIRLHDEVGVLGVTPHGITLLTVLKQPADELMKLKAGNSAAFSENLNKLMDRFKKPKRVSDLLDEA